MPGAAQTACSCCSVPASPDLPRASGDPAYSTTRMSTARMITRTPATSSQSLRLRFLGCSAISSLVGKRERNSSPRTPTKKGASSAPGCRLRGRGGTARLARGTSGRFGGRTASPTRSPYDVAGEGVAGPASCGVLRDRSHGAPTEKGHTRIGQETRSPPSHECPAAAGGSA